LAETVSHIGGGIVGTDIEAPTEGGSASDPLHVDQRPRPTATEDEIRKALGGVPRKPPEMEQQPEPRTVEVPGYANPGTLSRVVQKTVGGQTVEEFAPVLPGRTVELQGRIVESESLVALMTLIGFGSVKRRVEIPTSITQDPRNGTKLLSDRTGYPWTPANVTEVSKWIIVASQVDAAPTIRVTSAPRWAGDYLLVPGVNVKGRTGTYGERTPCSEEEARFAWRQVIGIGENNPRFAVYVGAAIIAPYLKRLNLDVRGFAADIFGDANRGKTQAMRVAASAFGEPREDALILDWNATENALLGQVRDAGILPVFFDDTSKAQRDKRKDAPDPVEDLVYRVSSGRDKARMHKDSTLAETGTFETVLLSTGEAPILSRGKGGMISRVVELEAPVVSDAGLQRDALEHARSAYGWPLHWMVASPWEVEPRLMPRYVDTGHALERAAMNFAACATGWNILGLLLETQTQGEMLGRTAFEEFAIRAEQVGLSQAERLWEALPSYALRNMSRIEAANASGSWGSSEGDIIGKLFAGGDLALMPEAVKELADRIGLGDPETALEGLAKVGRLRPDSSGKRSRPVRIAKKQVRAHYFVGVLPEEEQEAGTREGVPKAEPAPRTAETS
jgi:hypothetical protein